MSILYVCFSNLSMFHFWIFSLSNLFCLMFCFIIRFPVLVFQIISETIVGDSIAGKQIGNRIIVLFQQSQKYMLRLHIRWIVADISLLNCTTHQLGSCCVQRRSSQFRFFWVAIWFFRNFLIEWIFKNVDVDPESCLQYVVYLFILSHEFQD